MIADDDGVVNAPNRAIREIGAKKSDFDELINGRFLITFDSGIVVIKHWLINNQIRKDRYKATTYQDEMKKIYIKENRGYSLNSNVGEQWQPNGNQMATQSSLVKSSLGKVSIGKCSLVEDGNQVADETSDDDTHIFLGELKNVMLTQEQYAALKEKFKNVKLLIDKVSLWLPNNPRNNHYAVCLKFAANDNWPKREKVETVSAEPKPPAEPMPEDMKQELKEKYGTVFKDVPE